MKSIGKRIRELRAYLGMTQEDFSKKLKVNRSHISNLERGIDQPSSLILLAMQRVYGVSEQWLLEGRGRMSGVRIAEERAQYGIPPPDLKVVSRRELGELEQHEAFVPVRLMAEAIAAGDPRTVSDHDIEGYCLVYESWCRKPEDYVCIRLKGDSMEPCLPDGSIVAIHLKSRSPKRMVGKLVAARHEGGVVVKELAQADDHWVLLSYNKEHGPIVLDPLGEESPIIGKVAWWWARQE